MLVKSSGQILLLSGNGKKKHIMKLAILALVAAPIIAASYSWDSSWGRSKVYQYSKGESRHPCSLQTLAPGLTAQPTAHSRSKMATLTIHPTNTAWWTPTSNPFGPAMNMPCCVWCRIYPKIMNRSRAISVIAARRIARAKLWHPSSSQRTAARRSPPVTSIIIWSCRRR